MLGIILDEHCHKEVHYGGAGRKRRRKEAEAENTGSLRYKRILLEFILNLQVDSIKFYG